MNRENVYEIIEDLKTKPFFLTENTIETENGFVIIKKEYFEKIVKGKNE